MSLSLPLAVLLLLSPAPVAPGGSFHTAFARAPDAVRGPAVALPPAATHGPSFLLAPAAAPTGFGWPMVPVRIVRRFDPPARPWLAGHRGADLAGVPSQSVRAAGAGTVVHAGVIAGRGVVSVAHPGGLRTTYEPVTASVSVGDTVGRGTELGTLDSGHAGCPEPACLHWGLRRGDVYLDPLVLLGLGRVRLLPMAS